MDNEKEFFARKRNRLQKYDYRDPGFYFITICTSIRCNYFWESETQKNVRSQDVRLSEAGKIVDEAIRRIPYVYSNIAVDRYVIMPDHVHLLLEVKLASGSMQPSSCPSISQVIQHTKGYVTKRLGASIWQKLFYDHIIRNQKDYEEHAKYIYENPLKLSISM